MIFKRKTKQDQKPAAAIGRKTLPTIPCTDPAFKYVPAVHTDLAATFKAARERMGVAE